MSESSREARLPAGGLRILWSLTGGHRWRITVLALTSFAGAMLEAGFLVLLTTALLALAGGADQVGPVLGYSISVRAALGVAAVAVILRLALNLAVVQSSAGLSAVVRSEQRRRMAHAYLGSAWEVQQSEPAGRLQELVTSFVGRANAAVSAFAQGVTAALSLLAFLAAGLVIEPIATLVVLGSLALLGAILAPLRSRIRRAASSSADADLMFASSISELGSLGREMQVFGVRHRFIERIDALTDVAVEGQRRVQVLNGALSPMYTFFAYMAVIAGVGSLSLLGIGDLAAVGSVMLLMLRSLTYGQQLSSVLGAIAAALPSLQELESTAQRYEAVPADSGTAIPPSATPLTARHVSFSYASDRPALSDLHLTIERGQMLGVIGPSGAGKTTLAQLILGLRPPKQGSIRAAGVDLRDVDRAWWTSRVALVPQDPLLFTGTVAENIRFFRDDIPASALHRAAEQANILTDINALPEGFDSHLGERGTQLSGGQRQRLSIARALVGSPELIVLDEPTSALDGASEALIRQTLADLHGSVTVVIIAHRMSTLDLCDEILVIEDGRVTAQGPPQVLRATSEFYRHALSVAGMA
ncbi:MAG: ABC transporter ATP-binding protein [Dermatophilaceae bacterium]